MRRKKITSFLGALLSLVLLLGAIPMQQVNAQEDTTVIDEIYVNMTEPEAGGEILYSVSDTSPDNYEMNIFWEDIDVNDAPAEGSSFIKGHTYEFYIEFVMDKGYEISLENTKVYVNDKQMTFARGTSTKAGFYINYAIPADAEEPTKLIDSVNIQFDTPRVGTTPDLEPQVTEDGEPLLFAYGVVVLSDVQVPEPEVYMSNTCDCNGENYHVSKFTWSRDKGRTKDVHEKFARGKEYIREIHVKADPGYTFLAPDDLWVFINREKADSVFMPENDATEIVIIDTFYFEKLDGGKWVTDQYGTSYVYPDGSYERTGFCEIDGQTYYFTADGHMYTGWVNLLEEKYYFGEDGHMYTGWNWIDNECYYFDPDSGIMARDKYIGEDYVDESGAWVLDQWVYDEQAGRYWYRYADGTYPSSVLEEIDGEFYYFDENGYMITGWLHIDDYDYWMYFGESGAAVVESWCWIDGKCYYFYESGLMASDTVIDDSYVDESGAWIPDQWVYDEQAGRYWYSYSAGGYPYGQFLTIDQETYYFDESGYMVTGWLYDNVSDAWYYFKESGAAVVESWYWIDGECYYFHESGKMANDEYIDGYYVDASGKWAA